MTDYPPLGSDPAAAARLGLVPASAGYRSLAFTIDFTIWLLLAAPAVMGVVMIAIGDTTPWPLILVIAGIALSGLFALVQLLTHGRRGVTVGKAALRLRSVSVSDWGRPGFWRVVLRALVLWASTWVLIVVGPALLFASGLWDPQRRGRSILDRVGGCWVIDARAGLDPFDAKALRHARRALRDRADDGEELPSMASGAPEEIALRIPDARSRAGVVGPGGTGAQWELAGAEDDPGLIDGVPGATPPPASGLRRRAQATVRFDDGSVLRVPLLGLIGRDPEPGPGESPDALVRLEDPQRLMSKTHAAFGQDAEGVWIGDRGSRNGTQLLSPGGDAIDVPAGEHVRVPVGWTVQVGGRTFELVPRGADS